MSEQIKKGAIAVETQNIFPVIKKWLYSDKDIFLRELISNASDAITKHKRLVSLGEAAALPQPYKITVTLNKEHRTLTVSDNGIGMSEEEIDKYINQIALSGAVDFIEKYEKASDDASGIIGHFGLGFYSAFMIADNVDIISKSYAGFPAVKWSGNDSCEYFMEKAEKESCGTDIVLHVNDDENEFLDADRILGIINKFCSFMPYDIYFLESGKENEESKPVNDTHPLWQKKPSECSKQEYFDFYKKVFGDYRDPLFYIHINADYPLNFKGILYFPKISSGYEAMEGQVKLFYNQVFVADNIKEVIPEYLMVLRGVLDCPELPLNVSRSYLQANGYVSKISSHIVKKVADKLNSMFLSEKDSYEKMWDEISPFVKYGCMKDEKFYSKISESIIFKDIEGNFVTVKQYLEANKTKNIFYTTDTVRQSQYISMFKSEKVNVLVLDKIIDSQFISFLESKFAETEKFKECKFLRVDSELADFLKSSSEKSSQEDNSKLTDLFKKTLNIENLTIKAENLKDPDVPAILSTSEESRRFSDMMKMYSPDNDSQIPVSETLVLNLSNPLIEKIISNACDNSKEDINKKIIKQVYIYSLISKRDLSEKELHEFITENSSLLNLL